MITRKNIGRFGDDARGSVAIIAAASLVALIMVVGMAVDYASLIRQRAELQAAADAAAIAGAKEIPLAFSDLQQVELVASNYAKVNLGMSTDAPARDESDDDDDSSSLSRTSASMMMMSDSMMMTSESIAPSSDGGSAGGGASTAVGAQVIADDNAVEVTISKSWTPYFAGFLPIKSGNIEVTARAQVMGSGKICVLGLMQSSLFAGVHLDNSASISAPGCGVYSNSTSFASIRADAAASAEAEMICSAGGYWAQSSSSFSPAPTTDCPPIPDPLSERAAPSIGSCKAMGLVIDEDTTLSEGTYCGGIRVIDDATVTLQPGIYVIKDGPLMVENASQLIGQNVGIYLSGLDAIFHFGPDTSINLTAPTDGPMAGLLFMEASGIGGVRLHRIESNDARQLLGTIYLPSSILQVDADAPVADQSAYTAIVVMRLWLQDGLTLVLNSDYSATDVPVPDAIAGGKVILTN